MLSVPSPKAYVERYDRLTQHLFETVEEVHDYAINWMGSYNHERPTGRTRQYYPETKIGGGRLAFTLKPRQNGVTIQAGNWQYYFRKLFYEIVSGPE